MKHLCKIATVLFFFSFLYAEEVFIPKNKVDLSFVPPFTSNLLRNERKMQERKEHAKFENMIEDLLKGDDKDLEKQATKLLRDREKLDEFLGVFAKKDWKSNREEQISIDVQKFLDLQYKSIERYDKSLTLSLKNVDIKDLIELIGKTAGLNFVINPGVKGTISNINFNNIPLCAALKIVLSSNNPKLALVKELGILRIMPQGDVIAILKDKLRLKKQKDFISDFATIYNARWSETFKLQLEKMWYGIISNQSNNVGVYIVFDDSSKKVFFRGNREDVLAFKSFLKEIDIRVPQVKIEARVIIASKDFEESLGLQVSGIYNRSASINRGWGFVGFGPISSGVGSINPSNLMDWTLNLLPQTASTIVNIPFVFGGKDLDNKRLNLVLNMAESRNEIETLLKPTLLVSSGEPAEILVGQEVPIETRIQERIEGTLRDFNTVNYKDLGMKLKVKPIVSPDKKSVFLDIFVENSFLKDGSILTTFDAKKSIIVTTKSRNKVLLRSGQTTLIGGLISNDKRIAKRGVPFLQDIPFLGVFFRGSKRAKKDEQLMIFISPTVV